MAGRSLTILRYELGNLYIDLGAEKVLAAERAGKKLPLKLKVFCKTPLFQNFIPLWVNLLVIAYFWQNNIQNMCSI
jgi:hypothetical protein